jgi:sulfite reductase alpha subunit-like flavoprotein
LVSLGAVRACVTGLGDDNVDIEKDFSDWRQSVFFPDFLRICFGVDHLELRSKSVDKDPLSRVLMETRLAPKRSQLPFDALVHSGGGDLVSKFYFACNIVPVVTVRPLCPGKVHIDLDISKVPSLRYRTGDTLEVLPYNTMEDVDWVLGEYSLEGEDFMTFTKKSTSGKKLTVKKPFPTPCTVRQAVTRYIDLSSSPSRKLIRDLAFLCDNEEDSERIVESVKNQAGTVFTVRSLLENVFPKFASHIGFGDLIQILPKQKPRAYSICSSHLVDPKRISLVVSRMDDSALTSVWMTDRLAVNDIVLVTLKSGVFRLPTLPSQPVVMICTGTGFAPFRAFIAELKFKQRIAADRTILFFGCRTKNDWIYREEMEEFQQLGGKLHVAFSRENPNNVQYVQHLVEKEGDSLADLITKQNAAVYVCGSTAMGRDVMQAIDQIYPVADLRNTKRYIEELWG